MQLITCHSGRIQKLLAGQIAASKGKSFVTGLAELDEIAPNRVFARGAIHELLSPKGAPSALSFAMLLAKASQHQSTACTCGAAGAIVWSDPNRELYPPALANAGIDLKKLFVLRAKGADQFWAITEALRCKGVAAVVASMGKLSRVEARRLQLAAETGGSIGILLRPVGNASQIYAAATRWLVEPAEGQRTIQRWRIQLLHGHGGRIGQNVFLEFSRETNLVRATKQLADRTAQTQVA